MKVSGILNLTIILLLSYPIQAQPLPSEEDRHKLIEAVLNPLGLKCPRLLAKARPLNDVLEEGFWENEVVLSNFNASDINWMRSQSNEQYGWDDDYFKKVRVIRKRGLLFFKKKRLVFSSNPVFSLDGSIAIVQLSEVNKGAFSESIDIYQKTSEGWKFKTNVSSTLGSR
ncbi:hypothetical protein [Roseivirga thermotolerans]|uniref:SnoaL-like domain-containing protein n=1 Tax=Roseivirga thermotolerans TaxID=1758176 RepID=A0ABQ3IEZ2_9BACT|nr:hypothetical protein [Roseivirga thermotolerans]GHE76030.1 hypothetical protein GCM10011340_36110 [Roseivirga thermotolerans]|tara:strand:- start:634 stop:1143 length:510 start_codon:yes stop_codon:yes gene_type:complete